MNQKIERTVTERLKEVFVEANKKSVRAFALSIDGDPSYVAKMLNGERPVTESVATSIHKVYNVRISWLLYGKGEKYGQNEDNSGQLLTGAHVTLQDHINLLKDYNEKLFTLLSSSLGNLQEGQRTAIAYQKAWVDHIAEKESGGDPNKKEDLKYKFGKLVDDILSGAVVSGIQTGTGKRSKA